jgi:P pilus assembly chaperone PapD
MSAKHKIKAAHFMQKPLFSISLTLPGNGAVLSSTQIAGNLARNRTVKPGEAIEGSVQLKNHSNEPIQMHIRQVDYEAFTRPSGTPAQESNLLCIEPNEFRIEANESVHVHYHCKAPSARDIKGTYWAVALIERVAAASTAPGSIPLEEVSSRSVPFRKQHRTKTTSSLIAAA